MSFIQYLSLLQTITQPLSTRIPLSPGPTTSSKSTAHHIKSVCTALFTWKLLFSHLKKKFYIIFFCNVIIQQMLYRNSAQTQCHVLQIPRKRVAPTSTITPRHVLPALPHLTNYCHTGQLEVFHSYLLKYCSKRQHFFYEGRTEVIHCNRYLVVKNPPQSF